MKKESKNLKLRHFELRQLSRLQEGAQYVFLPPFSNQFVPISHMASSLQRLNLFLQLICLILISKNKGLGCPFTEDVKCQFTGRNDQNAKPVYFIPDRSDTFITCEPDPLLSYHLYPDGSGSSCQTFQYEFIQNKITLSTKPRSQSEHEFKAAVEKDDVWGIKIKKVVHQKLEAPDKIGGQQVEFGTNSSVESTLKLQAVFVFNFGSQKITIPSTSPFSRGAYFLKFITQESGEKNSLIFERVFSKNVDHARSIDRGIFGREILSSKVVTLLKTENVDEQYQVLVKPLSFVPRIEKPREAKVSKISQIMKWFTNS